MNATVTRASMGRRVSMESTGTTAHARQDTPATGVRQVGLNVSVMLVVTDFFLDRCKFYKQVN